MQILYTPHFKREAKRLPISLRSVVEARLAQFAIDPRQPALKVHKLDGRLKNFWAFSITASIRVIFEFEGADRAVFHSIGDHAIYDQF